jgi:hypothetical protein
MSKHGKNGKNGKDGKKAKGSARKKDKAKKSRPVPIDATKRSRLTLPGLVAVAVGVVLVAGITSLWRIRR